MKIRFLSVLLLALSASTANAQSTRARLDDLELRMGQIEEVVRGQALVELSQRLAALETEVRAIRGDLELLQKENSDLRKQQSDVVAEFERRLAALESQAAPTVAPSSVEAPVESPAATPVEAPVETPATPATPAEAPPATPVSTPPATPETPAAPAAAAASTPSESPEIAYGRAFDALKAARYADAIRGMTDFMARHSQHPLADNAQYWLAQTYYVTRDYPKALEAFAAVVQRAPDSAKAPDALYKRGLCELELARADVARATLNEVIRRYPQNDAARLAREQLARMR